jgi:hypothetical protein
MAHDHYAKPQKPQKTIMKGRRQPQTKKTPKKTPEEQIAGLGKPSNRKQTYSTDWMGKSEYNRKNWDSTLTETKSKSEMVVFDERVLNNLRDVACKKRWSEANKNLLSLIRNTTARLVANRIISCWRLARRWNCQCGEITIAEKWKEIFPQTVNVALIWIKLEKLISNGRLSVSQLESLLLENVFILSYPDDQNDLPKMPIGLAHALLVLYHKTMFSTPPSTTHCSPQPTSIEIVSSE